MTKETSKNKSAPKSPPSMTIEESENKCIANATRLAERMLEDGTAPNSMILHYLREGSRKREQEIEKLKYETELVKAKTEAVKASQRTEELIGDAIKAIQHYRGDEV